MANAVKNILHKFYFITFSRVLIFTFLVLPILTLLVYVFFISTDRYESVSSVYITEEQTKSSPLDLSVFGISGSGSSRDILVLKTFIDSQGMMLRLQNDLRILDHFANEKADMFSRLKKNAPVEKAYEHYLSRIHTKFDDEAQLLEISVQSYDKGFSKKILDQILVHSQTFIDELNENIKSSQLSYFDSAVKDAEADLINARQILIDFQQENAIYSTELTSQTIAGTISSLERELAQKQAELRSRLGILTQKSPTVLRIKAEINALQEQILKENSRLASDDESSLSKLDSTYREIELQIEYKTLRYRTNLQAFEQAQVDIARRFRFLTIVAEPTLAESSLYPNRPYIAITGSIIALAVYFVVSISFAIIREHS
ncbi:hypothetical protein FDK21_20325 [Cohaesibacter sp. CAU 1516]|uniref:hypothetical protein n=1 Tax=Cohaesibacter sp. CAU 1516 TaxID=2576038 RepID=UPI0010FF2BF0|nr:hypothetical protein [Cohaesibacter sp. CAU 1516]TLP42078.1 hypothetical protein FDK21_20325 [Cohaesibacter sp. CAU 1516]